MFKSLLFKYLRNHLLIAAALLLTLTAFPAISHAQAKPTATKPTAADATSKIDINTATIDQLKAIPGIGDAYSKRVVDGRPSANRASFSPKEYCPPPPTTRSRTRSSPLNRNS